MYVEFMRRPRLTFSIEAPVLDRPFPKGHPVKEARNLRVLVYNEPLPRRAN
jgi:hypothetical protein